MLHHLVSSRTPHEHAMADLEAAKPMCSHY